MISNDPERVDRPASAKEARARFDTHLRRLTTTPRTGLAARTGDFIDNLVARAGRYGDHLFVCFDDPRIPATTNELEGLHGDIKHTLRHSVGCGSTTNTVASNLGADAVIAFHYVRLPAARARLRETTAAPAAFQAVRSEVHRREAPAIRQRSVVRYFKRNLDRLREAWFGQSPS